MSDREKLFRRISSSSSFCPMETFYFFGSSPRLSFTSPYILVYGRQQQQSSWNGIVRGLVHTILFRLRVVISFTTTINISANENSCDCRLFHSGNSFFRFWFFLEFLRILDWKVDARQGVRWGGRESLTTQIRRYAKTLTHRHAQRFIQLGYAMKRAYIVHRNAKYQNE